jgi:maltooligosyltrehalose trehalohydrolase
MGDGATLRLVANLSDKDIAYASSNAGTLLWGDVSGDRLPPWSVIWHLGG